MKIIKSIHKYLFLLVLLLVILPGTKVKAEVTYDNCNENKNNVKSYMISKHITCEKNQLVYEIIIEPNLSYF